jgi:hypothetical protein
MALNSIESSGFLAGMQEPVTVQNSKTEQQQDMQTEHQVRNVAVSGRKLSQRTPQQDEADG